MSSRVHVRGVGIMDGGPAKCEKHNFTATNNKDWYAHIRGPDHLHTGVGECLECGARINYNHIKKKGSESAPLCDKCAKDRGLGAK